MITELRKHYEELVDQHRCFELYMSFLESKAENLLKSKVFTVMIPVFNEMSELD